MCRIEHLYQHIFPPDLAPSISFVGLPWKVVPFAQYELQAKWIARVLSGRASLPSRQKMHAHIQALYKELELNNVPKRCAFMCMANHANGKVQPADSEWQTRCSCHGPLAAFQSHKSSSLQHYLVPFYATFLCLVETASIDRCVRRYTHMLGDKQWAYNDWLADACGDVDRLPEWRPLMYKVAGEQESPELGRCRCTDIRSCMVKCCFQSMYKHRMVHTDLFMPVSLLLCVSYRMRCAVGRVCIGMHGVPKLPVEYGRAGRLVLLVQETPREPFQSATEMSGQRLSSST